MIYLEPNSTTPIIVTNEWGDDFWVAARIAQNGEGHRIKSKDLPPAETCKDAFEALRKWAEKHTILCIDHEIKVTGTPYRLQADPWGEVKGIGYIKHFAQAKTTTAELPGMKANKAPAGQFSWQKYVGPGQAPGWHGVVLEWTRLFLLYKEGLKDPQAVVPEIARGLPAKEGTRPDGAAPGKQISGETVEGEVLPPCAEISTGAERLPAPDAAVAKRGRGRPKLLEQIVPQRTIEERLQVITQYHRNAEASLAQGAISALMAGFELVALRPQVGNGPWSSFLEENLPFSPTTAWRYMEAAERMYKRIPTLKAVAAFALGTAPSSLSAPQHKRLIAAVKQSTDGATIQQLYFDLGVVKAPPKARGGNAKLLSWLQERYPEIEARREADLPADVLAEWREYSANAARIPLQEMQQLRILDAIKFWHENTAKLFDYADRHQTHTLLPLDQLEAACVSLQTTREILLADLKARREQ